ncbi:MAG: hypothetical protein JSU86_13045 [Phycisphaerales bacterium]|nr:MAG: hypothetical protein JSU86_13045 [Phycisphaerales bacterium]
MPIECPNCREPIPWSRVFFTTAWGSWTCNGCGSLLGVNVRRRLLGVAVLIIILLSVTSIVRVPLSWDLPIVLLIFLAVWVPYFLLFERARVLERRGFRCHRCGYDLQGQVDPRCPECGLEFSAADTARVARAKHDEDTERLARRGRHARLVVIIAALLFLGTVLGVGLTLYMAQARPVYAAETRKLLNALVAYSQGNSGLPLDHAIGMALDGHLVSADFVSFDSLTSAESVPLADISLSQFDELSVERKETVVRMAAEALPRRTVAHRLGDFVFTHHGVDLPGADPNLWLVIWSPDPGQNPRLQPQDVIPIGLVSGKVIQAQALKLVDMLPAQNQLRAEHSLPPLSSPFTVTHAKPMAAQP